MIFRLADNRKSGSLAVRWRRKRFKLFKDLIDTLPRPLTILDVGGTETFWKTMDFANEPGVKIVLFNMRIVDPGLPNFSSVAGDAADMSVFRDNYFDVVFSNSVIEHLGEHNRQARMAEEIKRVGKRYFIQTPNKFFPIEPHFLFPFFQFLPPGMKVFLVRHFNLGWHKKTKDKQKAREVIRSIRLLTEKELKGMFPGAMLYKEKTIGLTKSFIFYDGWQQAAWRRKYKYSGAI